LAHFVLRIAAKFMLGALLKPLFGQFQKGNSRKFGEQKAVGYPSTPDSRSSSSSAFCACSRARRSRSSLPERSATSSSINACVHPQLIPITEGHRDTGHDVPAATRRAQGLVPYPPHTWKTGSPR
jgi:hypothetical protein